MKISSFSTQPRNLFNRSVHGFGVFFFLILLGLPMSSQAQTLDKSGKNWKLQLKSQYLVDDNVAQNPDKPPVFIASDSDGAWNGGGSFNFKYRHNNKFSLFADYDVDATIYADLSQYDLVTQMWGLKPKYKFNSKSFLDMQYFYIWNIAGGTSFSGVNYVSPSYNHLSKWGLTRVHFFFKNTNNFVNQARDADQFGGGFTHIYMIPKTRNYVGFGYQMSDEDSVGRFDRQVHDLKLLGKVVLPMDVHLAGEYKFSFRDYDTFVAGHAGAIREDEQSNYRFKFTKVFWEKVGILEKVTGKFSFHRQDNQSNLVFRDYKSNRITWGISAKF